MVLRRNFVMTNLLGNRVQNIRQFVGDGAVADHGIATGFAPLFPERVFLVPSMTNDKDPRAAKGGQDILDGHRRAAQVNDRGNRSLKIFWNCFEQHRLVSEAANPL